MGQQAHGGEQQGGLALTVEAEQGDLLAGRDLEVDVGGDGWLRGLACSGRSPIALGAYRRERPRMSLVYQDCITLHLTVHK